MGIYEKFNFMGPVSRKKVLECLYNSDVFIMPSDYEGLSRSLLEAMSMGTVPVASRIPGSTDFIITDGKEGFLCERGKPKHFAKKNDELDKNNKL